MYIMVQIRGTNSSCGFCSRINLDPAGIENVKLSDAKEWALRMKEKGYGFKAINNHKRSLKAAFYTAIHV